MTNFISIIITFVMVLCSHNEFTEKDLIVYLVVLNFDSGLRLFNLDGEFDIHAASRLKYPGMLPRSCWIYLHNKPLSFLGLVGNEVVKCNWSLWTLFRRDIPDKHITQTISDDVRDNTNDLGMRCSINGLGDWAVGLFIVFPHAMRSMKVNWYLIPCGNLKL